MWSKEDSVCKICTAEINRLNTPTSMSYLQQEPYRRKAFCVQQNL